MAGLADRIGPFRKAFKAAAIAAIDDKTVLVTIGHPGKRQPPKIVAIGDTTAEIDFATMSPRRPREYTITQEGVVSVYVKGGQLAEEAASDQCFDLINRVEEFFRGDGTDAGNARTTLGGLVRWCLCTRIGPAGGFGDQQPIAAGRTVEAPFTFTAHARITS